jgi:hypothetical protein
MAQWLKRGFLTPERRKLSTGGSGVRLATEDLARGTWKTRKGIYMFGHMENPEGYIHVSDKEER